MKDEAVIKTTGPLSVNYFNGNKIRIFKNKTVEFSVINSSNEDAYYFIEFKNLIEKDTDYLFLVSFC